MQLYQGDCLEVMKQIPDKSVDMILCDLPYGSSACSWDIVIPFDKLWEQYNRIIKDDGVICLFGNEPFASKLRTSNLKYYRYDWIWDKGTHSNPLLAKKQPLRVYENICVFYKKFGKYNPQMEQGKPYKKDYGYEKHSTETLGNTVLVDKDNHTGMRYPKNIIKIGQNKNNREFSHPTAKPVLLCEYLIKTYTNENDIVLDNCMGSGTTGVACKRLNRNFIGIELDPKYFKIAEERIENEPTQLTLA
jgi:site-specific DNA-methyltransferase (adenine-specific)